MQTIKVVYTRESVLLDENNQTITYDMLPEHTRKIFNQGMNGHEMDFYQVIYDSYFPPDDDDSDLTLNTSFNENPEKVYLEYCLVTASSLKKCLPNTTILFRNDNNYYHLPLDIEGFSEIPENFDISSVVLFPEKKRLKIMFDHESTGLWNYEGKSIPLEYVPVSDTTRNLITSFQQGLNSMEIPYDRDYTWDEEKQYAGHMVTGLIAAMALKTELPDWQILLYNADCYFALPLNPYNNCSEIMSDLRLDDVMITSLKIS